MQNHFQLVAAFGKMADNLNSSNTIHSCMPLLFCPHEFLIVFAFLAFSPPFCRGPERNETLWQLAIDAYISLFCLLISMTIQPPKGKKKKKKKKKKTQKQKQIPCRIVVFFFFVCAFLLSLRCDVLLRLRSTSAQLTTRLLAANGRFYSSISCRVGCCLRPDGTRKRWGTLI